MNAMQSDNHRAYEMTALDVPRASEAGVEVRLVTIDLLASPEASQLAVLDDDERSRAARFLRREDAMRHAATRAALREALAQRLGRPAHTLRFGRDDAGRPRLVEAFDTPLDFNVSHSGAYALIALSATRRVGIDIESRRERFDWRSVAGSVFGPDEVAYLESLPDTLHCDAFYDAWTAKEALVKALGTGMALAGGIKGFAVLGGARGAGHSPQVRVVDRDALDDAGVSCYDALWCPAPAGYAACVAWSRAAHAPAGK